MSQFYEQTASGNVPVLLKDLKAYLKLEDTEQDDLVLTSLLKSATEFAEKYTARELRANTWTLLIDIFEARICLRKDPVASITTVKHLVSGVLTTVASSVYYLKKGTLRSEILLEDGQEWPTNTDEKEHPIEIVFDTEAHQSLEQAKVGIMRHVAFLYENRGDCDVQGKAVELSGAGALYDQIRIARS